MTDWRNCSATSERTMMRWVVMLTIVFIACLWSFVVFWGAHSRQETLSSAGKDLLRLSAAVEEQSRRTFKMVEVFLNSADLWLKNHPNRDARNDPELAAQIAIFRKATGNTVEIMLARDDGDVFALTGKSDQTLSNVGDREYFKVQLDPARRGYYIGAPVLRRSNQQWGVPISLPAGPRRDRVAAIFAVIDVEHIANQFEAERPQPGGSIALARRDGTLLARAPAVAELIGRPITLGGVTLASRGILASPSGGWPPQQQRLSYAVLDDLPLLVVISAADADILAAWRQQCWVVGIAGLLLTVISLLSARHLLGLLRRQSRDSAELRRLATTDGLTGALNRRTFLGELEKEVGRAARYGSPLTLMMLDLDFFKRINDGYGHAVGDQALKAFAESAFASLRSSDLFGRMGGEEFVILLPETSALQVEPVAERLRERVAAIQLPTAHGVVRFTVSIGVAELAICDVDAEGFLARADQAMYAAKQAGRNRVVLAPPPLAADAALA